MSLIHRTRAKITGTSSLFVNTIPCDAIRPHCELAACKGKQTLIYTSNRSKDDIQFTCKSTREAPRKDRPAKDAILFFEPYQLLPVIIGTEAGDWNEQTK